MTSHRYPLIHRLLHWLTALAVLGLLIAGFLFWYYEGFNGLKDAFGIETTNQIYLYHKSFGVVVLGLTVLRIAVKLTTTKPPYRVPLTGFERAASGAVHGMLYVLLIAMPVLGWAATAAGGFPIEFFGWKLPGLIGKDEELSKTLYMLHGWAGLGIAGLAALHVSAALRHGLIKRDGVLARMGFF